MTATGAVQPVRHRRAVTRIVRVADKYPDLLRPDNPPRRWSQRDPAGASEWVSANEAISPERAARLLPLLSPASP